MEALKNPENKDSHLEKLKKNIQYQPPDKLSYYTESSEYEFSH